MKKVLILDGSNIAFSIFSQFVDSKSGLMTSSAGIPTTIFFGMLRTLEAFTKKYEVDRVIICWDAKGGSTWRKKQFKHYKANRIGIYKNMDPYFAELKSAVEYLGACGIPQVPCEGIEADDVIGWLTQKYSDEGWRPIIFGNDGDMFQLLRIKNSRLWRPVKDTMYTKDDVPKEMGIEAKHLHKLQGLTGQKKDNIPGPCELDDKGVMIACRFGDVNALKLLANERNPTCSIEVCHDLLVHDSPLTPRLTEILLNKWDQVLVSVKLALIRSNTKLYEDWEVALLHKAYEKSIEQKQVQVTQLNHIATLLDINAISIPMVCRKIGIPLSGKIQDSHQNRRRVKV